MSQLASSPSEQILATIARLRCLSQISIQPGWRYRDDDLPPSDATNPDSWKSLAISEVNAKDHHPWKIGQTVRWLSRIVKVPADLHGYPLDGMCLRLALLWWATDAQVYVNGELVQSGDLFDCAPRILLSSSVKAGDEFAIALRLISPIHEDGALMKSVCHYETFDPNDFPEPAFVANELAVLHTFLEQFQPEKLDTLDNAIAKIDWASLASTPSTPPLLHPFTASLQTLRQTLLPLAEPIKQRHITLVGHAHLDMAWLWTVAETWEAAERTFRSVLNLQQDFPELTFAHTTPALYEWMEHNRPDLFAHIQEQVKAGKWEIVAGFWIEPELNLISGESIVRQVLYGQRYIQEKFGQTCTIAWVPDTFGFTWQLPQILKQGGVNYFVTQKLRWNDTTKFPHEVFQWQSPDGTQVFSLMSAPIGEAIDPVKMTDFAWNLEQKTGLQTTLWLPGVGDHGGGPTRDMLEVAQRWQRSPFFPQMKFGTVSKYLEEIKSQDLEVRSQENTATTETPYPALRTPHVLPTWNSDLYLEFHRGCYTTHAEQKRFNRRSEELLYQAELWASLATISTGATYPKAELQKAWKKVLLNQFHDILPGSSITQVFLDANEAWREVEQVCFEIIDRSQQAIAAQVNLPDPPYPDAVPMVVFNPLNWQRTEVVDLRSIESVVGNRKEESPCRICSSDGQEVEFYSYGHYYPHSNRTHWRMSFLAENIPSVGYRCFWFYYETSSQEPPKSKADSFTLENEFLCVIVDPLTGDLSSVFDKVNQVEVLKCSDAQLQAFEDKGQYWDAWNIDPNYQNFPLPTCDLLSIDSFFYGSLETRIQVKRKIGDSTFTQTYALPKGSPILKVENSVGWQERHVLVKAAFPLNLEADFATYEIPCGSIQRTTKPQTEAEQAQWEVPAMRWADLSDRNYGVSLLNDCKYGYDAQPNQLRLTLLRGSEWPDPEADKGWHTFTYAIYPHAGDWKQAQTVRRGYELDLPLQVVELNADQMSQSGTLPPVGSLLDLGAENLVLMALKQSEDAPDEWILRCYECHGEDAELNLSSDVNLRIETAVDLLEQPIGEPITKGQTITVSPWKIVSFKLKRDRD
ncbi:alpha-mannosidase [Phormidium sp. CLA17]|uniref:alpha-mannosidase n=1 Tax=Leptolyngbya sp. Cla-17 TaxID=2803751 RepID=UPI0014921B94|nr:alpha-mannosidase [Leptolyngbya sp. Cla-17]MBM0741937.1 alpha-mannosidase [Leptolyngbya sp. Cla-17]